MSPTRLQPIFRRSAAGFSIVESLVSVCLFGLCIAAFGKFLTTQIRIAGSNFLASAAYSLAAQELESVRTLDYGSMVSRSSTQQVGNETFSIATSVSPDQPEPNMKTVAVTVGWTESSGAKNVKVSTIYTQVTR